MYKFSQASEARLWGVDERLQEIARLALSRSRIDFGIGFLGGLRTASEQYDLFLKKKSKVDGTTNRSKHQEGLAIDVVAYVDGRPRWEKEYYYMLAGTILAVAAEKGLPLRWGGDWDSDNDFLDQTFNDFGHFEVANVNHNQE